MRTAFFKITGNFERIASAGEGCKMAKRVVVATDEGGDEALYVDGELRQSDSTIYACDIADAVNSAEITFEHINVKLPDELLEDVWADWPKLFSDLESCIKAG